MKKKNIKKEVVVQEQEIEQENEPFIEKINEVIPEPKPEPEVKKVQVKERGKDKKPVVSSNWSFETHFFN